MNDDFINDMLSLMSDIVMAADTRGVIDEASLDQLHSLIEVYFQETDDEPEQPH